MGDYLPFAPSHWYGKASTALSKPAYQVLASAEEPRATGHAFPQVSVIGSGVEGTTED